MFGYFHDKSRIYLILEYASNGDLFEQLQKMKVLSASKVAKYIHDIASAIEYCHKKHIIHRDIKPENILLDHNDNIKLCDFGWSVQSRSSRRTSLCGT